MLKVSTFACHIASGEVTFILLVRWHLQRIVSHFESTKKTTWNSSLSHLRCYFMKKQHYIAHKKNELTSVAKIATYSNLLTLHKRAKAENVYSCHINKVLFYRLLKSERWKTGLYIYRIKECIVTSYISVIRARAIRSPHSHFLFALSHVSYVHLESFFSIIIIIIIKLKCYDVRKTIFFIQTHLSVRLWNLFANTIICTCTLDFSASCTSLWDERSEQNECHERREKKTFEKVL